MFDQHVALGDRQTDGLDDSDEAGGNRGWPDRLAERLAELNPRRPLTAVLPSSR